MGNGASIDQDIRWRLHASNNQIKAHAQVCAKLHSNGLTCEPNFSQAIKKAYHNNVISKASMANYKAINRNGNNGKHHDWDKPKK
jgi:hypothetical protein